MYSEVTLQRDNLIKRGTVKGRTLSPDSSVIGACDDNHVLDTLASDVEFKYRDVR